MTKDGAIGVSKQGAHGALGLTMIAMCVDLLNILHRVSILLKGIDGRLVLVLIRSTDTGFRSQLLLFQAGI